MKDKETAMPKKVRLEPGENVLRSAKGNIQTNSLLGISVEGRLFLTETRVIFEHQFGNAFSIFPLSEVYSACKSRQRPFPLFFLPIAPAMQLRGNDGRAIAQFTMKGQGFKNPHPEWVEAINGVIATKRAGQ